MGEPLVQGLAADTRSPDAGQPVHDLKSKTGLSRWHAPQHLHNDAASPQAYCRWGAKVAPLPVGWSLADGRGKT